ncbi:MAG: HtaA domain-containing protein, partial [Propionibacteriaceae bacterium]|nr:HtaA domain-containing protein [Propionibacteriaceae bacterium]
MPNQVTGGSLSWGLKESFRRYLLGPIAHGSITAGDPASDDGSRTLFPAGGGQWGGEVTTLGSVRYYGHDGELDLTLVNPRLRSSSPAMLVMDARDSDGTWHRDLELARVDLAGAVGIDGDTVTITRAATRLTSSGAAIFAYGGSPMYPAGTELDPLNASFAVDTSAPSPTPPVTTLPVPSVTPSTSRVPTPSPTSSKSSKPRGGSLTWGVRASFRSYVTGPIAKGAITVSSGAGTSGGNYRFGQTSTTADLPDPDGTTRYRGTVRFTGHHGELDLALSDPAIRISGSSGVLSIAATGHGRLNLATLDLAAGKRSTRDGAVTYAGVPAELTQAGAAV